ncbi:antibiotic biosynthesis monooxygenase [Dactylosporangium sp. NPDC005572]|uniref:antibiotic biosynthesis monooxygenase n=1 Tax=Dactylosporangium sp. NPDC005572 TaxID=3156889 RepID=UPI0033B9DA15
MLVVTRFVVDDPAGFPERAHAALGALAACPGYLRGSLGRAYDDPAHWTILTEWESVGAYRRALSNFDVKMYATPLLAQSLDEPSAFEELATVAPGGELTVTASDRA